MNKDLITKKYEKMSDFNLFGVIKNEKIPQILRDEATHALWYRYERQTHKMEQALKRRIAENRGLKGIDTDGVFTGAYENAFLKAVNGVKLNKVISPKYEATVRGKLAGKSESEIQIELNKKRQSWKFYQGYQFYLQNYINRDIVGKYIKTCGKDLQMSVFTTEEGEDFSENVNLSSETYMAADESYFQSENTKIFWDAVNSAMKKFNDKQLTIWKMREKGEHKKVISERTGLTSAEIGRELTSMKETLNSEIRRQEKIHKMEFTLN